MAMIGMRYVVATPLTAHTDGSEPTYGTGVVVGRAMTANLTINRANNTLRADDIDAEDDNGITSMQVSIGVDDISEEVQATPLGLLEKVTTGSGQTEQTYYLESAKSGNYVGLGYMRVRRYHGVTSYQGIWIYKAIFGFTSENAETKQETINWQTPTLEGKAEALQTRGSGEPVFRKKANFTTAAACIAWLNGLAGISA